MNSTEYDDPPPATGEQRCVEQATAHTPLLPDGATRQTPNAPLLQEGIMNASLGGLAPTNHRGVTEA